tara:strand:- start:11031 stop:12077 length:1047 start_codon:yes stop_codon:yes gene_type:complete
MPYSQKKNPVKMMKSALHMYKAEKKQGMHRDSAMYMNSPMYAGHESPMEAGHESPMEAGHESPMENASKYGIQGVDELKYMPIVDDMHRKGDSPAKAAKPDFLDLDKDGDKTEPMKEAAKGSPAKAKGDRLKKRITRKQEQVDAAKASFGTDNVDKSFDRKLKSLKRKLKKADKRGINIENYDTRDASGSGKVKTSRHKKGVLHGETFVITKSPAKMKDKNSGKSHGEMSKREATDHGMVYHTAKHPKYDKTPRSNSPVKAKGGRKNHPGSDEDYKKHVARNSTKADEHHHKSSPFNRQGYNARLDESLAKDGKESSMNQSLKDRRDESKGMKKSMGKGAYSSDPKMS